MPFTIAHAVLAPPIARLTRGRLPMSALAIGCMSPDFAYLVDLGTQKQFGHTPAGILLEDLPIGLAVLWGYHRVLKSPLLRLAPGRWRGAAEALDAPFAFMPVARLLALTAAVVLGAASHVLWDSFTHLGRWGTMQVPALHHFYTLGGRTLPGSKLAQWGCGVAGMLVIAWWSVRWLWRQPSASRVAVGPPVNARLWLAVIAVTTLGGTIAAAAETWSRYGPAVEAIAARSAIAGMASLAAALTLTALAIRWRLREAPLRGGR